MDNIPFVAIGNDELAGRPIVHAGDLIHCPHCNEQHTLEAGISSNTGQPSEYLLFYDCGDATYLAAVKNRLLTPTLDSQ